MNISSAPLRNPSAAKLLILCEGRAHAAIKPKIADEFINKVTLKKSAAKNASMS